MKKTIRMNEIEFNRLINESVKRVLNEGYTQGDINGALQQWQQQGLQNIRQNNGGMKGYTINQVGNSFHDSIPLQNTFSNATFLLNKTQKFYQYIMNNDMQSAMTIFGDIQGLVENIYTNLEQYYQEQQNIQKVGGKQWQ